MPYMKVSLTHKLTDEKRSELLLALQDALWTIPEKKGVPVVIDYEEGKTFYTGGVKQDDFISVDVQYFSNMKYTRKKEFTEGACAAMEKVLGFSKEHMFLLITERNTWGAHGEFLDEFFTDF